MKIARWIVSAAAGAAACSLAVHHATPVDAALPAIAVAVTLFAALSYSAVMLGVPLLITAEIAIPADELRLLAFGAIVATSAAVAIAFPRPPHSPEETRDALWPAPVLGVALIVLLRWIPLAEVRFPREVALLFLAAAIVFVLGRTPFAVAIGVVTALVTPAVPLRTLALPLLVLAVSILARWFGMPRLAWTWPSAMVIAFVMLFFAWSGVVARATPWFLRKVEPKGERIAIGYALAANRSAALEVPQNARALVLSGANVAGFRRGRVLGRIDPGGIPVKIGDVADWGYVRRDHFYGSRNPLPRDPIGQLRGFGYTAWIDGAARVALPRGAKTIRITADAALPPGASLQVEGFELAPR